MIHNQTYTIWQNVCFCMKRIAHKAGGRFFVPEAVWILAGTALPFLAAFFPSTLIRMLTEEAAPSAMITVVLGFVLALSACSLLSALSRTYIGKTLLQFRVLDMALDYKLLSFSYAHLETSEAQKDWQQAQKAHYSGSEEGIEKTLQAPCDIAGAVLSILLYACVTATLHPLLVLVLLACSCIQAIFIYRNLPFLHDNLEQYTASYTSLRLMEQQCLRVEPAKDIRAYRTAGWFQHKMAQYSDRLYRLDHRKNLRQFGIQAIGRGAVLLRDAICYGYLIYQVFHGMDLASFTLYLSIFAGFTGYFEKIVQSYRDLADTSPMITSFRNYLDEPKYQILTGVRPVPAGPHSFTFENVSFCYPDTEEPVLSRLNFTIRPGEKLALVGLNGAGKTTLVKLLSGLYRPTGGRILMDGIDIQEFDEAAYYDSISTVFQDDFTIAFPLTENVACVPDGQEDAPRLWEALSLAGLADKIRSFPSHIHTRLYQDIDEHGILLSGGETQKLMLARALYKNAATLILDEPTAALDPLAEAEMYQKYNDMTENKTSIFISHRLSSTRFCDRILLLDHGQILEEGSHETLMNAGGAYASLFQTQAQYYQKEAPTL